MAGIKKRALRGTGESQAPLRHPGNTPYGCFLSDLTRFDGTRRAGPSPLHCTRAARHAKAAQCEVSLANALHSVNQMPPAARRSNGKLVLDVCEHLFYH